MMPAKIAAKYDLWALFGQPALLISATQLLSRAKHFLLGKNVDRIGMKSATVEIQICDSTNFWGGKPGKVITHIGKSFWCRAGKDALQIPC